MLSDEEFRKLISGNPSNNEDVSTNLENAVAGMESHAQIVATYYNGLRDRGVTEQAAIVFTRELILNIYARAGQQ